MNVKFNLTAKCTVNNAGAFPSKEALEQMITDCLDQEMGIQADLTVTEYRQTNF